MHEEECQDIDNVLSSETFGEIPPETFESFEKLPDKKLVFEVEEKSPKKIPFEMTEERNEWEIIETPNVTESNEYQILTFEEEPQPSTSSTKSPTKQKTKSRKKKYKPTFVKRMKLDADGEMVPEDICDKKDDDAIVNTEIAPESPPKVPQIDDAKSADDFDLESFVVSLDFDNLVVVEASKDGKTFFEIHKSDPETQEVLDEPLNIPEKYVDMIVKLMTQPDDEEAEENLDLM